MKRAKIFYQANGETPEKDNTVPSTGNGERVTTNLQFLGATPNYEVQSILNLQDEEIVYSSE